MRMETVAEVETKLRELAGVLLAEGKVDVVIGYERGTLPLRTTPCFIREAEAAGKLVWDATCEHNLARYLRSQRGRVAIVAKGCDARAITVLLSERQLARDQLFIIGVACQGVVDRRKVQAYLADRELQQATLAGAQVVFGGEGWQESLPLKELLWDGCLTCRQHTPLLYDALIGEPLAGDSEGALEEYADVAALEAMTADERWAHFSSELSRCLRCYACRQACPLCYCPECFVDQTQPAWCGKTDETTDLITFHIVRALHSAGRCADCGACSRACPVGIDLRSLNRKLIKDIKQWYGYEAGLDPDALAPLATFRPDDPQEFIE
jgi:formate dehydrogenase subunit beta